MNEGDRLRAEVLGSFLICLGLAMVAGAGINDARAFFGVFGGAMAVFAIAMLLPLWRGK